MAQYADLNSQFKTDNPASKIVVYDIDDIKNSLLRLFTTGKGEVPFNRNYGTTLKNLLFENNLNPSDASNFLYMDIMDWEPRVVVSPADIRISQINTNSYKIFCSFRVPLLNNVSSAVEAVLSQG